MLFTETLIEVLQFRSKVQVVVFSIEHTLCSQGVTQ